MRPARGVRVLLQGTHVYIQVAHAAMPQKRRRVTDGSTQYTQASHRCTSSINVVSLPVAINHAVLMHKSVSKAKTPSACAV